MRLPACRRSPTCHRWLLSAAFAWASVAGCVQAAEEPLQVRIGYLAYIPDTGPILSNVIPEPRDAGLRGAELAIVDSNSTGRFLKQTYSLRL
jgi:hypothetical protein